MDAPSEARPGPIGHSSPMSPTRVLLWTSWFGVVGGTLELVVFLLKCHYFDPRNYNTSRQFVWMHPAAGLMVLGGPGLLLAVAARFRPRWARPTIVVGTLSFLAYLGLLFRLPIYTAVCLLLAGGLAVRTASFLGSRLDRLDRAAGRCTLVVSGLIAAVAVAGCGREAWTGFRADDRRSKAAPGARNVILIVLDTVRARSLGLYGYGRDTSPNLARLAARGVRFDHAISTAPWTAPSHASLFTGRWSHELSVGWDRPLDRAFPTLAESLGNHGYETAGFVANATYCSYETGLDRGFGHFEDYDVTPGSVLLCSSLVQRGLNFLHHHPGLARLAGPVASIGGPRKSAERINGDFLGWLDRPRARPFFAFLNYFDAHHPYLLPGPSEGREFGRRPETPRDLDTLRTWWDLDKRKLGSADVELARDSYDRCIAYLDHQLGRLFDELERRGILEETLIVVTADHGEHLGEQRLFGHGCSLYLPEIHVPLLMVGPGLVPEGRVVDDPVSLRDVPSTVVERLGLRGVSPFPGRSLATAWGREAGSPVGTVLSEIQAPPEGDPNRGESPACRGPMVSLMGKRFHYIRGADGREELYEFRVDPDETRNLAGLPGSVPVLEAFRTSPRR